MLPTASRGSTLGVKHALRGLVVTGPQFWPRKQATVDGRVDQFLFFTARRFQHVIDDLVALARMTDP